MASWTALLGRAFLATLFLAGGAGRLAHFDSARTALLQLGLPFPGFLAATSAAVELIGGALLVIGLKARLAALVLAIYLIPVTALFHRGPEQRAQLAKNLSILGGLLLALAHGPGELSLDRAARERTETRPKR